MEEKMEPEKKFVAGGVVVSVWNNEVETEGGKRNFKSVSFARRYKDKEGTWKTASSLKLTDIPKAIMALGKAYEHLTLK